MIHISFFLAASSLSTLALEITFKISSTTTTGADTPMTRTLGVNHPMAYQS